MATWQDLDAELEAWARAGRRATLWWRADDAAEATAALHRLLSLAAKTGLPLHLAVIPARLAPDLEPALSARPEARVLQHGYAHLNHAEASERAAELARGRPVATVREELARGARRLKEGALPRTLPVLVPPWNRIAPSLEACLAELGFRVLSTFSPREQREPAPGLLQVNAHCDPVDWKNGKRFRGDERSLEMLVEHLAARRGGTVDPDEPTGLLTHHLQMDEPCWDFVEAVLERTSRHRGAAWIGLETVMEQDSAAIGAGCG
jgi:hypothetical protein